MNTRLALLVCLCVTTVACSDNSARTVNGSSFVQSLDPKKDTSDSMQLRSVDGSNQTSTDSKARDVWDFTWIEILQWLAFFPFRLGQQ